MRRRSDITVQELIDILSTFPKGATVMGAMEGDTELEAALSVDPDQDGLEGPDDDTHDNVVYISVWVE